MSVTTSTSAPDEGPRVDWLAVAAAAGLFIFGGAFLADWYSARHGLLFLIGGLLGVALFHAAFGFTGGWRNFILNRRGASIRAQCFMIALATLFFLPLLGAGSIWGQPLFGFVAPVGVSVFVGAFFFGLGMQLGGGCGSGTLFTVGGGSVRMVVTLIFFILGSVLATAHLHWWLALPNIGAVSLAGQLGVAPALVLQLVVLGALAALSYVMERRRHGDVLHGSTAPTSASFGERIMHGPWPLIWGGVALAMLNVATLVTAGRPWGITSAFALWGAKGFEAIGVNVASWPFWTWPQNAAALSDSVLADVTSVMNFGLILGAMAAAGMAGRYAQAAKLPLGSLMAAVIGGLLMGYGARLAFGCNIGALFSGIASGSLHGWLWLVAAFAGSMVGVRMRKLFGI